MTGVDASGNHGASTPTGAALLLEMDVVELDADIEIEAGTRDLTERDDGEIVSSDVVFLKVRLLAASAPEAPNSSVKVALALSKEVSGGFSLKLAGFGGGIKATYKVSGEVSTSCGAGETIFGYLRIPVIREMRRWRPDGAGEWFLRTVWRPYPDLTIKRVGAWFGPGSLDELKPFGDGTPIGGAVAHEESFEESISVSAELSFGVSFGPKDANEFKVEASITGTLTVSSEIKVPAGEFQRYLLRYPAGVVVTADQAT